MNIISSIYKYFFPNYINNLIIFDSSSFDSFEKSSIENLKNDVIRYYKKKLLFNLINDIKNNTDSTELINILENFEKNFERKLLYHTTKNIDIPDITKEININNKTIYLSSSPIR